MIRSTSSTMNRQTFIDRLRTWAARAENEVAESKGIGKHTWQGQASVLRATASVVASGGSLNADPEILRKQLIADRQKSLTAWEHADDPNAVAELSGEVAAYELILTLLKDVENGWS